MLRLTTASAAIALLSLGLLTTAACSVVVGADDDLGGSPGVGGDGTGGKKGSGGSGSGGKASGGSAGETASGGMASGSGGLGGTSPKLDCQADGSAEGTYAPPATSSACAVCLQNNCETSFETCYSVEPDSACLYGSTAFMVGGKTVEGEFDCMISCFNALVEDDNFLGDEVDLESCQAECGSAECDPNQAGPVTTTLAECLLGLSTDEDPDGCQAECGL